MLGQKVLPAILLLSPATIALLSVHTTVVEAASNECKAKPDSAAPAGSRWYYRVSRVDQSRCWFLSSRDVSVHSRLSQTAPVTRSHVITPTSEAPVTQQDRQIGPQIASAIEPAEEQLALGQTTVPQMAPDPPRSDELLARKVATVSYRPAVASTRPASDALVQAQPSGARDRKHRRFQRRISWCGGCDKSVARRRSLPSHSSSQIARLRTRRSAKCRPTYNY